jgi:hypothetical protein
MADYIAKLRNDADGGLAPEIEADAVTEFEAAALALKRFHQQGVPFDARTGLELLQGNVTHSKPVPVKDIIYWLRNKKEGRALVEKDGLQPLLEYVPE